MSLNAHQNEHQHIHDKGRDSDRVRKTHLHLPFKGRFAQLLASLRDGTTTVLGTAGCIILLFARHGDQTVLSRYESNSSVGCNRISVVAISYHTESVALLILLGNYTIRGPTDILQLLPQSLGLAVAATTALHVKAKPPRPRRFCRLWDIDQLIKATFFPFPFLASR